MRSVHYGSNPVGAPRLRPVEPAAVVHAEADLVVEERATGFCGAVIACDKHAVELEDRHHARRSFPLLDAGFLLEGKPVTLVPPVSGRSASATSPAARTASGSVKVAGARARVARAGRILVEGKHDAELVEKVWGDDLRIEGVVVELLDGLDNLPDAIRDFGPGPGRRIGVLADHLVPGTKESRIAAQVRNPSVLILGHPYVDVWQAVKPAAFGIERWPVVPRGRAVEGGRLRRADAAARPASGLASHPRFGAFVRRPRDSTAPRRRRTHRFRHRRRGRPTPGRVIAVGISQEVASSGRHESCGRGAVDLRRAR